MTAAEHDELLRQALPLAGSRIQAARSFLERTLDAALADAVEELWPGATTKRGAHVELVGWERLRDGLAPRHRESDLQVLAPGETEPCILTEQKIWDVDASLFDAAKLLSFGQLPNVQSTYLVAAGTPRHFDVAHPGGSLYADGVRRWSQTELTMGAWASTWTKHLAQGRIAPETLPMHFTTDLIARASVPAFPDHEIRCVRVTGEMEGSVARFTGGQLSAPGN